MKLFPVLYESKSGERSIELVRCLEDAERLVKDWISEVEDEGHCITVLGTCYAYDEDTGAFVEAMTPIHFTG